MSKLVYAASKAGFETAYNNTALGNNVVLTDSGNPIYKSVVFTTDGYLYTHGKFFRIFDATNPFNVTSSNNIVSLKDGSGTELVNFDIGIISANGADNITATTTSGAVTIKHNKVSVGFGGTAGGTANTDTVSVPSFTVDDYGHITVKSSSIANLDYVKVKADITTDSEYKVILGSTAGIVETIQLNKSNYLKFNPSSGTLSASVFKQNGLKLSEIYAPISHANAASTYGSGSDTKYGHLKLSDSTSSTSGVSSGVAATPSAVKSALDAAKSYSDGILASNDAMIFKGTLGTGGTITTLPTTGLYNTGWTYRIITQGTYAGIVCEPGDLIICIVDRAAGVAGANADWTVAQTNVDGAVTAADNLTANQLILGNGTKNVKTLAAGTNGKVLTMVSGSPAWATNVDTWRAIKVDGTQRLASSTNTALDFIASTGISLSWNGTSNGVTIATNLQALDIRNQGTSAGSYSPSGITNNAINFADGLSASLLSNVFKVGHTNSITAGSKKLYSFAYDGYGHITGTPTEVTSLPNANSLVLKFDTGTTENTSLYTYNGSTAKTIDIKAGTNVSLTKAANTITINSTNTTYSFYNLVFKNSAGTVIDTYKPSTSPTKTFQAGSNVTIDSSGTDVIRIAATDTNTWRNVTAYSTGATSTINQVLSTSIGTADLQFGDEFVWNATSEELKLGWAEIDGAGVVTYTI